jgi:hypothetical protein
LKQRKIASSVIITFQVMTFSGMSTGHPDAVCALTQGSQEKLRAHSPGARDPNYPDIGWIFHASDTREIGRTIAAPIA